MEATRAARGKLYDFDHRFILHPVGFICPMTHANLDSRISFFTTREVANQILSGQCAVLEQQSDLIINQIQQTANERLTQCLEGLTP